MPDEQRGLIERAKKHQPSLPSITGPVYCEMPESRTCTHCGQTWPCDAVTFYESAAQALNNAYLQRDAARLDVAAAERRLAESEQDVAALTERAEKAEGERDEARAEQASANARAAGWSMDLERITRELAAARAANNHLGIPTGPGTIAAELTDPATHGKTLDRKPDGTYRTVGRARQRKPKNLATRLFKEDVDRADQA